MLPLENRIVLYIKLTQAYTDKLKQDKITYQDVLAENGFTEEEIRIIQTEIYPICEHENERGRACSRCGQRIA